MHAASRQEYLESLGDGFFAEWTAGKLLGTVSATGHVTTGHKRRVNVAVRAHSTLYRLPTLCD